MSKVSQSAGEGCSANGRMPWLVHVEWGGIDERRLNGVCVSGPTTQQTAEAERSARIDGPPGSHSVADSVRLGQEATE
ncbi:MAG TPA: hypothetical protein DD706_23280 [Nitrospiraceae bacterium]|nr:hypothetical protein [Nitrospiraceae bacterium]